MNKQLILLMCVFGCAEPEPSMHLCVDTLTRLRDETAMTEFGFTGEELRSLGTYSGTQPVTEAWNEAPTGTVTHDVVADGRAWSVERVQDPDTELLRVIVTCTPSIRVDGTVTIETSDGAFRETFDVWIDADKPGEAQWRKELDQEDIRGSYEPPLDPEVYSGWSVIFSGYNTGTEAGGRVWLVGHFRDSGTDGRTVLRW